MDDGILLTKRLLDNNFGMTEEEVTLVQENQYLRNKNISLETTSNNLVKVLNKLTNSNTFSTAWTMATADSLRTFAVSASQSHKHSASDSCDFLQPKTSSVLQELD